MKVVWQTQPKRTLQIEFHAFLVKSRIVCSWVYKCNFLPIENLLQRLSKNLGKITHSSPIFIKSYSFSFAICCPLNSPSLQQKRAEPPPAVSRIDWPGSTPAPSPPGPAPRRRLRRRTSRRRLRTPCCRRPGARDETVANLGGHRG